MPGYSGTPLPKKLGIKQGFRVALAGMPFDVEAELRSSLAECTVVKAPRTPLDFALVFVTRQSDLRKHFARLVEQLAPAGMVWISWPKKSSGMTTDVNENDVRRFGLAAGLVDVKVCAISEIWSGLKFVRRMKDR